MSSSECKEFALALVNFIQNYPRAPKGRPHWTRGNLKALHDFVESEYVQARFPNAVHYLDRKYDFVRVRHGEFMKFDYSAYVPGVVASGETIVGKGFLIFAESEYNKSTTSIEPDFEKLLYVRAPCKVMICWPKHVKDADEIVDRLSKYADDNCNQFAPGEVYVLYFSNWGSNMEEAAYYWQAPGNPSEQCVLPFRFEPILLR
jgi:hypothetical protein